MATDDEVLALLDNDIQDAFMAFRSEPGAETWTPLSALYIGSLTVFDGVQMLDPAFENPYPLDAADVAEGAFYQWPAIPQGDLVLKAILRLCQERKSRG
jgi:hypothetical protein